MPDVACFSLTESLYRVPSVRGRRSGSMVDHIARPAMQQKGIKLSCEWYRMETNIVPIVMISSKVLASGMACDPYDSLNTSFWYARTRTIVAKYCESTVALGF